MDKIIYHSMSLRCEPPRAFEMFTLKEHLEQWLTELADIEPRVGGKYELFWNPRDKQNDRTIGCKVLAIQSGKLLSFEWKGPKQFKHFMNEARPLTSVAVFFLPEGDHTEVHLLHTGWRDAADWEEAREWFDRVWLDALKKLQKYASG